jgi:hypothetical protein
MTKGDRVKHTLAPDWGIGRVLEPPRDGKVKIFFATAGIKLLAVSAPLAIVQGADALNVALDNLPDDTSRLKVHKTLAELKEQFLRRFPGGFQGDSYQATERDYKEEAHKLATKLFSPSRVKRGTSSNSSAEICEDAMRLVQATNLIFPNEKMSFRDGLRSTEAKAEFAKQLCDLLSDEGLSETRFVNFCRVLEEIGASKWTVATYFLFIFAPQDHMFMKPLVTIRAAEICAFELNYSPQPNWLTYSKLLIFAKYLKEELKELKPRDMIDVQSFIWCTGER